MNDSLSYRGRKISEQDVLFIRDFIACHPGSSRYALSVRLCEAWDWRQANGVLRHEVCRGLMLMLHRAGHIELPAARRPQIKPRDKSLGYGRPSLDENPMICPLQELPEVEFQQVRQKPQEALFNGLIEAHHYLGYTQPVGEHLKFLVYAGKRPLACFAWCSAPRHLGCRDRFIGWRPESRRRQIHLIAYNTRFLILPWVRVPHLASHLIAGMTRRLAEEWQRVYAHQVHFAETFVEPGRFRGSCYRAANWISLGFTSGRGNNDQTFCQNRPIKEMLGYPLHRRFREILCGEVA
jgi:hypothetical protein